LDNNLPKHPTRQGSSQIAAQLILKEPRTSNNKASLEIKSNDASSNISNSLLSECSSASNRKAVEIAVRHGKNTPKKKGKEYSDGPIMEQVTQHKPAIHGANARRERSSDPSGKGEVTAKMMEPNPEAENKREKIGKEETKQAMNHNQKDDDDLPLAQEDIDASGKELAQKHHFVHYLDDATPDHELQQLEITLSRKSKPHLTTSNNTKAPTTPAQLLSFKAVQEHEQNQSK
jgi:hypothetical protein